MSQDELPISITSELDSSITSTFESSNVYEPVVYNTDQGKSCTEASKKTETTSAAVTNNDKVRTCSNIMQYVFYCCNDHTSVCLTNA